MAISEKRLILSSY